MSECWTERFSAKRDNVALMHLSYRSGVIYGCAVARPHFMKLYESCARFCGFIWSLGRNMSSEMNFPEMFIVDFPLESKKSSS